MPEYCLNCDYEEELELRQTRVTITVRGEEFEATKEFYQCPTCGEGFTSSLNHDPLDEVYRKYRQRHHLLQPEEIRQWREHYELTPADVSEFFGWESTTVRGYEAGALQTEEHDKQLKWLMQPLNLLQLIENKKERWSEAKRNLLLPVRERVKPVPLVKDAMSLGQVGNNNRFIVAHLK